MDEQKYLSSIVTPYKGIEAGQHHHTHRRPHTVSVTSLRERKKYRLPSATSLVGSNSGYVERWPANRATSAISATLTRDRHFIVHDDDAAGKPKVIPRPKFLENLETFVKRELKQLGAEKMEASNIRLQVFRQVFDLLLEDFTTYRPILSTIKNEYEMVLSKQNLEIQHLRPLKQMLTTVTDECEQKLIEFRGTEKHAIRMLQAENKELHKKVSQLRHENDTIQIQTDKLKEELASEHLMYRDMADSRKLLLSKLNDLKLQHEDFSFHCDDADIDLRDDPLTMKIALRKARERERSLSQELQDMIANYNGVVPLHDHQLLTVKSENQEMEIKKLKQELNILGKNYDIIQDKYSDLQVQLLQYKEELQVIEKNELTPRPAWDKCGDCVEGGMLRWRKLRKGKRSNELVDVLLKEMGRKINHPNPSEGTPSTGDTLSSKFEDEAVEGLVIITTRLAMHLVDCDLKAGSKLCLSKDEWTDALKKFFPVKNEENIKELVSTAEIQLDALRSKDNIKYKRLFNEDEAGHIGRFLLELRRQFMQERREYITDIWEELADLPMVGVEDLKRALSIVDPEIVEADMLKYVCWAFNVEDKSELGEAEPLDQSALILRLQKSILHRIGQGL